MGARVTIPAAAFVRPSRPKRKAQIAWRHKREQCPFRNSRPNMNIVASISTGSKTTWEIAVDTGLDIGVISPRLASMSKRMPPFVEREGFVGRHVRWKITPAGKTAMLSAVVRKASK